MLTSRHNILAGFAFFFFMNEDTNNIIINTVKEEMDIDILRNDSDRSHHIGNPKIRKK